MSLSDSLTISTAAGRRRVSLASYIDPAAEERAQLAAYRWIKGLRHLRVDGEPFRQRFTVRGDSLWWFSEIYLHKARTVLDIHRAIAGLKALLDQEAPAQLQLENPSLVLAHVASTLLPGRRVRGPAPPPERTWRNRLRAMYRRAWRLHLLALLAPDRFRRETHVNGPDVAAFIHRAFWQGREEDGAAETYIGPVLREIETRFGGGRVHYVGVGPATHFRAHRPWRVERGSSVVVPVERYASPAALAGARGMWRARKRHLAAMEQSADLREWSVVEGVDCWRLVREQLAGIAWLQWPWSVRTMDEAAAALETLEPAVVLTYAEAGGWGRALILEARRRGIPSVGLQHGFIYRHWLNYLHEPDEMLDDGFPRPTRTLLFDDYARRHLETHGRFPASSLTVTGSPKLDALVQSVRQLSERDVAQVRAHLGVNGDVLLVTTKEREARGCLGPLLDAAARYPSVTVVIKPHPAENAVVYAGATRGRPRVRVVPAAEPLAPLLAVARAVATVNSTVALDAGALGVPAIAVGLPNNLSPFVDAGALAGSTDPAELLGLVGRILYDERFRQQLARGREHILGSSALRSDGGAAGRSADVIASLIRTSDRQG